MKNIKQIFDFLHTVEKLKRTYRFETVNNIEGDSTADHTWRMSLMTFMIAEELKLDLDILRCLKLALTHDLPEAITGDIDTKKRIKENIESSRKEADEEKAMRELEKLLPKKIGAEIFALWKEYQTGETKEARFVKAIDKIEGVMTHIELSKSLDVPEITASYGHEAMKKFPEIMGLYKIFKQELKQEFKKQNLEWKKEYDDYV